MSARPRVVPVHPAQRWLPLPLGAVLAQAANVLDDRAVFEPLAPRRTAELKAMAAGALGSVYLFSDYLWSLDRNLRLSRAVRAADPRAVIIHGGPSVPRAHGAAAAFLEAAPEVDVLVLGEGELTLSAVLEALVGGGPETAAGTAGSCVRVDRELVFGEPRPLAPDLDSLASPYLDGWFDDLAGEEVGATIESDRGCPYGCSFCDWGAAVLSRVRCRSLAVVEAEIEWLASRQVRRIDLANANFGSLDRDIEVAQMLAAARRRTGAPVEVGLNFPKNDASRVTEILGILCAAGIRPHGKAAVQTLAAEPLRLARRRNLPQAEFRALNEAAAALGLPLGTDIMIGLPGSTVRTVAADLGYCVREDVPASTTPVVLLPNAPMATPEFRSLHRLQTNDRGWLVQTSSYDVHDFAVMQRLARIYNWVEARQLLRLLLRYLDDECGIPPDAVLEALATSDLPSCLTFLTTVDGVGFPTDEDQWQVVHQAVLDVLVAAGVAQTPWDDRVLQTVLLAQRSVMPIPSAQVPRTVVLEHDLTTWWRDRATGGKARIVALSPGQFSVHDPRRLTERISAGVAGLLFSEDLERAPVLDSPFSARSPAGR